MYIYSYIYMEKHHFALHTKNEVTSASMGTQSFCELILHKAGQTTWSFIWKKTLLILQQDRSVSNPSVSRTCMFPPNWKHLSGTVNMGKVQWIHKGPTTCHRQFVKCKGGISCGKGLLWFPFWTTSPLLPRQGKHISPFAYPQAPCWCESSCHSAHAKDKLAKINNKTMENFLLKIQETKSSFDSQWHRGCNSWTQGSWTGTFLGSIRRKKVFSPKPIPCTGAAVALMGEDCFFFLPQTSLRSGQSSV